LDIIQYTPQLVTLELTEFVTSDAGSIYFGTENPVPPLRNLLVHLDRSGQHRPKHLHFLSDLLKAVAGTLRVLRLRDFTCEDLHTSLDRPILHLTHFEFGRCEIIVDGNTDHDDDPALASALLAAARCSDLRQLLYGLADTDARPSTASQLSAIADGLAGFPRLERLGIRAQRGSGLRSVASWVLELAREGRVSLGTTSVASKGASTIWLVVPTVRASP
jgi:hypothetical protein